MNGKRKEISGWYGQRQMTPGERADEERRIDAWYDRAQRLNYRTAPVEIPGKMMLDLGREAREKGVSFSEFVEGILAEYLRSSKMGRAVKRAASRG